MLNKPVQLRMPRNLKLRIQTAFKSYMKKSNNTRCSFPEKEKDKGVAYVLRSRDEISSSEVELLSIDPADKMKINDILTPKCQT